MEDKEKKEMAEDMEKEDGQLVIDREGGRRDGKCNLIFSVPLFFLGWSGVDESTAVQSTHMETHLENDNLMLVRNVPNPFSSCQLNHP